MTYEEINQYILDYSLEVQKEIDKEWQEVRKRLGLSVTEEYNK